MIMKNKNVKFNSLDMERITTISFYSNPHGDGVYYSGDDKTYKDITKRNYIKDTEIIKKSDFILSHQRLATHGSIIIENTHPFKFKNWILAHNGVLDSKHINKNENDSKIFFEYLLNNGLTKAKTDIDILKTIKKALNEFLGSFSIVLYNSETKKAYYFKSPTPEIHIYKIKGNGYFVTTNNKTMQVLSDRIQKELKVNEWVLYCFYQNEDTEWKIKTIGKVLETKYKYNYYDYYKKRYNYDYYKKRYLNSENEEWEEYRKRYLNSENEEWEQYLNSEMFVYDYD